MSKVIRGELDEIIEDLENDEVLEIM